MIDVIVVGGGNAGFTAAHAAAIRGRRVVLLEKADREHAFGNSYFTAGATRIAHGGSRTCRTLSTPTSGTRSRRSPHTHPRSTPPTWRR